MLSGAGLACRRGGRLIFHELSCAVASGGALVLTGANGSGKSSLLRLLATLLPAAAGRLAWNGSPVRDDLAGYRADLHYVGHLDAIKPALTGREMLAFWAALRGVRPQIEAALAALALDAVADFPCRWLSAGQRRRLALARLIAAPAPLWLLDEPTTGLDRDSQARLEQALVAHREGGGLVVLTTHVPIALPGAQTLALGDFAPDPAAPLALDAAATW